MAKKCKKCWCINENPLLKYCMKHADMNKKLQTYKPLVQKTPGTYPELRNIKENISLVCSLKCHWEIDKLFSWILRQEHIQVIYNSKL